MSPEALAALIDALLDGDISEADFLRLEAELHVDPAARRTYYERQKLHLLLANEASRNAIIPDAANAKPHVPAGRRFPSRLLALAATIVALLSLGILAWRSVQTPDFAQAEETRATGYAVLAGHFNPVWKSAAPLTEGDLIPAGPLHLQSGVARLELFSGVSVVLEGDAEFEILSDMEMKVLRGKVRARVPEAATGFRIHTPNGDLVDLGTEFALDVTAAKSEVHVLDGEIEWHPENAAMQRMTEGQAMRKLATGPGEKINADPARFIGIDELRQRADANRLQRRSHWLDFSRRLSADPRVVVHYRMTDSALDQRRVTNHAGTTMNGAIVAAATDSDRFGSADGALDFSPTGSRVRLQIPDELGSLTFLAWVKINSLDRLYNSLFLTDGHDLGEPHWQILNDGRLFFSAKKREGGKGPDKHVFHSPQIWTPAMSGQWMMIATVYDLDANAVTHYINGEAVSIESIPEEDRVQAVRIGAASIGNWSEPAYRKEPEFAVRNLNGSMDEFLLFKAALPAGEIARIYQIGKP
ncbi:MAG: LamG-like jellyroll fold domain-containing protein [Prosthecobacter sp.]